MNKNLRSLTMAALLAALTAALTTAPHLFQQPNGSYVHLGDLFVYLAGCLLPTPYAMSAAAIGGGLADVISGAPQYAIPTVVIKALIALGFSAKKEKILCPRNALALLPAAALTMGGYFLADRILTNSWQAALFYLPFNLLQAALSAVLFVPLAFAMDKAGLKRKI